MSPIARNLNQKKSIRREMQCKFVSFEDDVKRTIKSCPAQTAGVKPRICDGDIKGYKFVSKNRLVKTSNQVWLEDDWMKFTQLAREYKETKQYDRLRCLIMAAWHQCRAAPPPRGVLL